MSKKLMVCSCGSCSDAAFRALALYETMIRDQECPSFAYAVGYAMMGMQTTILAAHLEGEGVPQAVAQYAALDWAASLTRRMQDGMNANSAELTAELMAMLKRNRDSIQDAMDSMNRPKGD